MLPCQDGMSVYFHESVTKKSCLFTCIAVDHVQFNWLSNAERLRVRKGGCKWTRLVSPNHRDDVLINLSPLSIFWSYQLVDIHRARISDAAHAAINRYLILTVSIMCCEDVIDTLVNPAIVAGACFSGHEVNVCKYITDTIDFDDLSSKVTPMLSSNLQRTKYMQLIASRSKNFDWIIPLTWWEYSTTQKLLIKQPAYHFMTCRSTLRWT